jgi:hypothetical protein
VQACILAVDKPHIAVSNRSYENNAARRNPKTGVRTHSPPLIASANRIVANREPFTQQSGQNALAPTE